MYRAQLQDLCRDRSGRAIPVLAERAETYRLLAEQWERQGKGRLGTALVPLSAYLAAEEFFKDRPAELDHKRYLSRSGIAPKEFKRLELQLGPALRQQLAETRRSVKSVGDSISQGPATPSSSSSRSAQHTPSRAGSAVKRLVEHADGTGELTPEAKRARAAAIQSGEAFGFSGPSSATNSAASTPSNRKRFVDRLQAGGGGGSTLLARDDMEQDTSTTSTPRTPSGRVSRVPASWNAPSAEKAGVVPPSPAKEAAPSSPASGRRKATATATTAAPAPSSPSARTARASASSTPRQSQAASRAAPPSSTKAAPLQPSPARAKRYPFTLLEGPYEPGRSDSEEEEDDGLHKLAPDEEAAQDRRRRARIAWDEKRWNALVAELKRRDPALKERLEAIP